MNSYFYSGQIRRFLQQFIRMLSNFQVAIGNDEQGNATLLQVPIYYGDMNRQVAMILRNNSENATPTVPAMAVYVNALKYDQKRMQEPFHVSKLHLRQRAVDDNGEYTSEQGDMVTVERLMPVPYLLTLKCDIWTSNTDQKLQLLEQIAVLFNPSMEIQSTDNYVDWTSLTYVTLLDTNFTSRTIPMGTEDAIDVATLTFEIPIWISAPAKVKKMGVIQRIIESIWDANGTIDQNNQTFDESQSGLMSRRIYTPANYSLLYIGNTLKLSKSDFTNNFTPGVTSAPAGEVKWSDIVKNFGRLTNGISQIRLEQPGVTVIGTVAYHPTDDSMLLFTPIVDTLPANNLNPINAIIDPFNITVNSDLLVPLPGTRYLILNDIGDPINQHGAAVWNRPGQPQLIARANDIIEFDGFKWSVSFDSTSTSTVKYVTNLRTNTQYKWKDQQWTKSVEGQYGAGAWSFVP